MAVAPTGYSPLANGALIDDDTLAEIGSRYEKTALQVALRWGTQHEHVLTNPMSTSCEHLASNLDVFDFRLTREEHYRITDPSYLRTAWPTLRSQLDH